jgi:two-component system NtrC family sensor kinase
MTHSFRKDTVMIVDDSPANLSLLGKMLTEQGYRVRAFPKGKLALKSALNDQPDLILLDINMPEMNGYEVCKRLKQDERTQDLPVIFISALAETIDKIKAFKLGGVDYITKPFQIDEVDARISLHLALKRTKAALEEKNQKLEKTLDDLKITQQQLVQSEKMAALGVLVAGIAHEINNPINFIKTSILGLSQDIEDLEKLLNINEACLDTCQASPEVKRIQTIKDNIDYPTLKAEIPQLIENIQHGVHRTQDIINSLRSYSRMDRVTTEETDPLKLIEMALIILRNRYKHRITIVKNFKPLPKLWVHPGKLTQVLINIISNAIDAIEAKTCSEKGTITITSNHKIRNDISYGVISIHDDGVGISEKIIAKIFDPFFTTKGIGDGTGLGLSISIGIIKEHQGMIDVSTAKGNSTTFSIFLPINSAKKSGNHIDSHAQIEPFYSV